MSTEKKLGKWLFFKSAEQVLGKILINMGPAAVAEC